MTAPFATDRRPPFEVAPCADRDALYEFLSQDRRFAGYAIGDLEPGYFENSNYFLARNSGRPAALLLLHRATALTMLFAVGDSRGLEAILRQVTDLPAYVWLGVREEHLSVLGLHYTLDDPARMYRLTTSPDTYRPISPRAARLGRADLPAVADIYDLEPESELLEQQVRRGVYYGVYQGGRLVSIAGTHVISRTHAVAAVGNVYTRPEYRGLGFATHCTAGVTSELLEFCTDVVLNVRTDNAPALRLYRKLGYGVHCPFREGRGTRRRRPR